MGLIGFFVSKLIYIAALFLLIIFVPGLPPDDVNFTAYSEKPTLPFQDALALNSNLNGAERLFENELKGPEAFAIYNGELYTGIHGGHIVKIKNNKIVPVLKFGKACEGLWEEEKCGRVLGITFDKDGSLYAVDAYYGVFKVNMSSGDIKTIVEKDEVIDGKPVKLPNSLDVSRDGNFVYWTISSTSHALYDGMYIILADGNGRLMRTDLKKNTHQVLIEGIQFANGVVLSEDESFLLVAETGRARVIRYYLKGPHKGTHDIFIDGLPGLPDNLKRDKKGGFLIPLIKPVDDKNPYLPAILAPYPLVRKFIVRVASLVELSIKFLNDIYPNVYLQKSMHFIGHFESLAFISGKRVTVIRTDSNGKIIEALHGTDGSVSDICEIEYFNGAYYLGSPFNMYLGRVAVKK